EGARVYAVDVDRDGLHATLAAIEQAGGIAQGQPCDVADMASVHTAVDAAVAAFGGLDVLCNIAGIGGFKGLQGHLLDDLDPPSRSTPPACSTPWPRRCRTSSPIPSAAWSTSARRRRSVARPTPRSTRRRRRRC